MKGIIILYFMQAGCFDDTVPTTIEENSHSDVCKVFAEDADASTDNSLITYSLEGPDAGMSNTKSHP